KRPLREGEFLANQPLYTGPSAFHAATLRRFGWISAVVGIYVGKLSAGAAAASGAYMPALYGLAVAVPLTLPLPFILWFSAPYVTRIYRLYRRGETDTVAKLEKDERLVFETLTASGRKTYNTEVPLKDLRIVNKRHGWVNLELQYDDKKGQKSQFYVQDNIGGYKMDRIWGIIENNSGIDNGRYN
ncbi:hypothetical protein CANCADRAFT_19365, partial [Tortispora caseinolytica NRRL Y-17796]